MKNSSNQSIMKGLTSFVKLACLVAAVYFVVKCIDAQEADDELALQPTPVVINDIKPIGELYAFTAITEDFTIDNVEKVGLFRKSYYKAVQTMRMQVSYVLSLDSVDYQPLGQSGDTIRVRLPQLRYVQTAQGGNFLCEVEVSNYNANRAIGIVEKKIKSKYDTPLNRQKAMTHVREVITSFVNQCGKVPLFEYKK